VDFAESRELRELAATAFAVGTAAAATRPIKEDSWVAGFSREFALELGRLGWLGMTWPTAEGGGGRSVIERFMVFEALIAAGAPVASCWVGERQIGPTLLAFGTDAQRRRYLPAMLSGSSCWAIGMSEPDAGSDLAAVRTSARPTASGWRIDGQKIWTSFGAEADHIYVIARTDQSAPAHRGMSEFIVDLDAPGVEVRTIRDMTGEDHFCEVYFDGVEVPGGSLVGELNGSWQQVMRQLEHERGGIDRLVANKALFLDALEIADLTAPLVRHEVADLVGRLKIGRLLVLRQLHPDPPPASAAMVKVFCTELEQRIATFAANAFGANAMLAGRVSRAVLYAQAYSIQGGTNTILRTVLAERALGLPK
jgi:alkylation response protein AidB-like acyl-CoA dehydrogenase